MWKKSVGGRCKVNSYNDDRMLSIAADICETTVLFINVYLLCDNGENYNAFMEYLSRINATIENHSSPYVYVLGDYNANLRINSNKTNIVEIWERVEKVL